MAHLRRPLSWYEEWMGGSGLAIACREKIATDHMNSIQSGSFDSQTLEEMQYVLDHERFLLQSVNSGERKKPSDVCALKPAWISHLLTKVSGGIVVSINTSAPVERELQARIFLSALALLRAHGVERFQTEYHDALSTHIEARHRDSILQRSSAQFTPAKFRTFHTSYLLCLAREYTRALKRDESRIFTGVNVAVVCGFAALAIGSSLAMGNGTGNLHATAQSLDKALKPLWRDPSHYTNGLLQLQELTQLTVALNLSARVAISSCAPPKAEMASIGALRQSAAVAQSILHKILQAFDDIKDFNTVSQSSPFLEHFRAITTRGPRRLDTYFYLYGLLDCATQLARITPFEDITSAFKIRMSRIIAQSKEPSFRWKAIEFLLCWALTREDQERRILREHGSVVEQLSLEVSVISQYLQEEEGSWTTRAVSVDSSPTEINTLQHHDWREPSFPSTTVSSGAAVERFNFNFAEDLHKVRTDQCVVHLSPDCETVVVFSKALLLLYKFTHFNSKPLPVTLHPSKSKDLKAAAVSDHFLAVLTPQALELYNHKGTSLRSVGELSWESEATNSWTARCLAIYETSEQIWIAVGGRTGLVNGDIQMYLLERRTLYLCRQNPSINRSRTRCLVSDHPKSVTFSSDGSRLSCITNRNRVLVWFMSNNMRPRSAPFEIEKPYAMESNKGVTSTTIFYNVAERPYLLCTTLPSSERSRNRGEWSYICPIGPAPAVVPRSLEHDLSKLGKSSDILTGAVSTGGKMVALLHQSGKISLLGLTSRAAKASDPSRGGLVVQEGPVTLKTGLICPNESPRSPMCMRFRRDADGDTLIAVDSKGNIMRKRFLQAREPAPLTLDPLREPSNVWSDGPNNSGRGLFSGTIGLELTLPTLSIAPDFSPNSEKSISLPSQDVPV